VPFAPHLFFPTFLDDDKAEERHRGITGGIGIMERSDEVWFYVPPWRSGLSTGMQHELDTAQSLGKRFVIIKTHDEWEGHLERVRALIG